MNFFKDLSIFLGKSITAMLFMLVINISVLSLIILSLPYIIDGLVPNNDSFISLSIFYFTFMFSSIIIWLFTNTLDKKTNDLNYSILNGIYTKLLVMFKITGLYTLIMTTAISFMFNIIFILVIFFDFNVHYLIEEQWGIIASVSLIWSIFIMNDIEKLYGIKSPVIGESFNERDTDGY